MVEVAQHHEHAAALGPERVVHGHLDDLEGDVRGAGGRGLRRGGDWSVKSDWSVKGDWSLKGDWWMKEKEAESTGS